MSESLNYSWFILDAVVLIFIVFIYSFYLKLCWEIKVVGMGEREKKMEIHLNQTSQPITHTGYKTGTQTQTHRFDYDDQNFLS